MPVKREPAEPQGSIKPNGVGIPALQDGEEVNGGDDYECRMTVLKADDTTITITRPWHHHWTDGWNWKTIIRQWLSDVPETFEPYDGLAEWLRDADSERIDCWHCLSWLANHRRSAVESLSNAEKKRLASRLGFEWIAGEKRP